MAGDAPLPGRLEEAVRSAVEQARCSPDHRTEAPGRLRPQPHAVREQLARFRALRRRLLAAPDDSRLQTGLQDAAYTLCVLIGRTTAYSAPQEAELRRHPPQRQASPAMPRAPQSAPAARAHALNGQAGRNARIRSRSPTFRRGQTAADRGLVAAVKVEGQRPGIAGPA
ncbi:DUF5133 domain-containing protein [Streptomyces sp. 3211.6]|uniref:DUF5133 domain-containing protein n=1 Tax=Streptomyces sp. 3211.6 TaxID=1938845 RepID=UPI000EB0E552